MSLSAWLLIIGMVFIGSAVWLDLHGKSIISDRNKASWQSVPDAPDFKFGPQKHYFETKVYTVPKNKKLAPGWKEFLNEEIK